MTDLTEYLIALRDRITDGYGTLFRSDRNTLAEAANRLTELEAERDQWKRAADGDRAGLLTNEYHLRVVRALVTERKESEAENKRLREALAEIEATPTGCLADHSRIAAAALHPGGEDD